MLARSLSQYQHAARSSAGLPRGSISTGKRGSSNAPFAMSCDRFLRRRRRACGAVRPARRADFSLHRAVLDSVRGRRRRRALLRAFPRARRGRLARRAAAVVRRTRPRSLCRHIPNEKRTVERRQSTADRVFASLSRQPGRSSAWDGVRNRIGARRRAGQGPLASRDLVRGISDRRDRRSARIQPRSARDQAVRHAARLYFIYPRLRRRNRDNRCRQRSRAMHRSPRLLCHFARIDPQERPGARHRHRLGIA
ncbi:MAG: hypothetical protein BWZ10_02107 [candidate division BRC1 bacterium ADurb.BinA364]|nr:MAG: hypothetical protein BWZ10_02107 [candidate division BRC1 bacterium ADurb.BinA364]